MIFLSCRLQIFLGNEIIFVSFVNVYSTSSCMILLINVVVFIINGGNISLKIQKIQVCDLCAVLRMLLVNCVGKNVHKDVAISELCY